MVELWMTQHLRKCIKIPTFSCFRYKKYNIHLMWKYRGVKTVQNWRNKLEFEKFGSFLYNIELMSTFFQRLNCYFSHSWSEYEPNANIKIKDTCVFNLNSQYILQQLFFIYKEILDIYGRHSLYSWNSREFL